MERRAVSTLSPARRWPTFECPGVIVSSTLVVSDPMNGDAKGWLGDELKSPD